ncbi:MAG: hypothetical protein AB8G99_03100 [Planctomycetaceae bacterium]
MLGQLPFLYVVSNMMSCAFGVSDYGFSCVIYADTKDDARDWGATVAKRYASRFGFPPHGIRPDDSEIVQNSVVIVCPEPEGADHTCIVGEFPRSLQ